MHLKNPVSCLYTGDIPSSDIIPLSLIISLIVNLSPVKKNISYNLNRNIHYFV